MPYTYEEAEAEELDVIQTQGVNDNAQESNNELTEEEYATAELLKGSPEFFEDVSVELFKSLAAKGIAADAGDEGWMRGFRWHNYIPRR